MIKYKSLKKEGLEFYNWSHKNPVGKIPSEIAKEGAGENRIPFAHFANSVPVYLIFRNIINKGKQRKATVLDVGCGTGRNISFVKETTLKKSYNFYGVDYSHACISYAQLQYKEQGVIFINYQGKTLPFQDQSFDFIISSHVIEHTKKEQGEKLIMEIARILKKNGIAVIGTPNRKYCQDLFWKNPSDEEKYRLVLPHEHEYYYQELKGLLQKYKDKFESYSIYQTINKTNRKLMIKAIDKIKPKPGLINQLKFNLYVFLRHSSKIQDLVAKFGTELILKMMKVSYKELIESTNLIEDNKQDIGDNFMVIIKK